MFKNNVLIWLEQVLKVAAIIYKASCLINLDRIYILYCYLFLSYINYCSKMWGNTYVTNIWCITVLQERVVHLVCGAKRLEYTSTLFKQLCILKFVDLVKFKTAIIMHKAYHNVLLNNLQNMVLDRKMASEVIVCIPT